MSRASAEQLAAAQRAQAARAASMQARRNASSSRPVSRGHSARPPFARQIAPKSGGLYNILYHGDGDCATYVGTFLDALSLTRLESTGRIFQKGGMDSIIQRAAFAQLHKAKYYFALKAAAGSYEPYEKAYKFVTERKLANKKRREERAKAMKAREAALARRAAHANANANANAKAKANAGGDNAGKRVVQNTSTAVPSAKTPAALPAGNVSSGDTVSNDASSGAAKAVKKAKTEASGITPAGTCAKRQLSADMLELATEVGNGNDESKKTGDGNVGSNPSSSDNSTDSSSSSSSAVDPSSPPQIGLDSAYGKRILIRLWTDVVSFTRKCRRSMVLRICELLLNPASYITGGYNKKKLKTQDTCFKYDAYKIPEPAFVRLKARLNCPRREASSVICDGIVYSIGGVYGLQALRTVEKYSFAQERWVAVTPMPKQRRGGASCSINGKIYIAGGYEDGVGSLINVYEYDPHFRGSASMANSSQFPLLQRGNWKMLSEDPSIARMGPAFCALGDSLYLIGGGSEFSFQEEGFARADGERYDFSTKKWSAIAPMNNPRRDACALVSGGKIYIRGGRGAGDRPVLSMECYDPATNTWTEVIKVVRDDAFKDMMRKQTHGVRACIADAILADFENKNVFDHKEIQGSDGEAQRAIQLGGLC